MFMGYLGKGTAAAVLIGFWCAAPARADDAVSIIEGWLAAGEGYEWLAVTHDGIAHDAASDVAVVEGLTVRISLEGEVSDTTPISYVFHFPQIAFEGLGSDDSYFWATSMTAETAEAVFQAGSPNGVSTGYATYHGLGASNIYWARLPEIEDDPSRPISRFYPLISALLDVSFDEMVVGGVTASSDNQEPLMSTTMEYGPTIVGPTESGNVSSMTMEGMTFRVEYHDPASAVGDNFEMTFGEITAENYHYGDLFRVLLDPEGETGTGDEEYETVLGSVSLAGVELVTEAGTFSVGEYRITDFGVRPPTQPLLAGADALFLASQEGKEPDEQEVIEFVGAMYGAMRLGMFEVADMAGEFGDYSGGLGTFGLTGLSSAGLESIYYRGLDVEEPGAFAFKLGDVTVTDLGFPSIRALMEFEQARLMGDFVSMMAAIPTVGSISYSDIRVFMPGLVDIELAHNMLEMSGHVNAIPTRIRSSLEGFRMPTWMMDGEAAEVFHSLGYEELAADYDLDIAWDEESSDLGLAASATVKDAGTLSLNATIGGVPREIFEDPGSAVFVADMLTLAKASVEFVDASVTGRALGMFAEQQGMDPETLKAQASAMLPFILASLERPSFSNMVTAAVQTFLRTNGRIVITASPAEPAPLMEMLMAVEYDPGSVVDTLNIEVSAQ